MKPALRPSSVLARGRPIIGATRKCRPDWDLSAPGLRENWEQGDKLQHFPYGRPMPFAPGD